MMFSLNEIEAMGKRAARGAGYSWGLAEEAGKATRWLAARGLPGPEPLAEILERNDGKRYDEIAPVSADGVWRATSGWLCPLAAGAALCDRAAQIADGNVIALGPAAQPLLLVPYGAGAAKLTSVPIELSWPGAVFIVAGDTVEFDAGDTALNARCVDSVRCRRATRAPVRFTDRGAEPRVDTETWNRLETLAQRTYAPATEASRLVGAGTGRADRD